MIRYIIGMILMAESAFMVLPMLVSVIYGEYDVTIHTNEKISKNSIILKWAAFTLIAFFANCGSSLTQKIYVNSFSNPNTSAFVTTHFTFSAIIALGLYFILFASGKKCSYKVGKKLYLQRFLYV